MPFLVQSCLDDHTLSVTYRNSEEAFAKAVEWHVTGRFACVSIGDGTKRSWIEEVALAMSLIAIAKTVDDSVVAQGAETNDARGYRPYDRYASRAWATKMPTLRTTRNAATTSKNMGQP